MTPEHLINLSEGSIERQRSAIKDLFGISDIHFFLISLEADSDHAFRSIATALGKTLSPQEILLWAESPLRALGGLTPREYVKSLKGFFSLASLLSGIG